MMAIIIVVAVLVPVLVALFVTAAVLGRRERVSRSTSANWKERGETRGRVRGETYSTVRSEPEATLRIKVIRKDGTVEDHGQVPATRRR